MDKRSRHERLYRTLADMGLCVVPVFSHGDADCIDYLMVSATEAAITAQDSAKETTGSSVSLPVARSVVDESVIPSENRGDNVIHMPTVGRI